MRRLKWMLIVAGAVGLVACSAQAPSPAETPADAPADTPAAPIVSQVERGEYLVTAMACADCHTPMRMGPGGPEPDPARRLSGHPQDVRVEAVTLPDGFLMAANETNTAFVGPWGISYAANITGDMNTGVGMYTEEMFIAAMRQGRHMGNERPLMPPMPWQAIGSLTDDDLNAILAYLKTVDPVANAVSGHVH